jgi:hypothetical protein
MLLGAPGPGPSAAPVPAPSQQAIEDACKSAYGTEWEPLQAARKAKANEEAIRRAARLHDACRGWTQGEALLGTLYAEVLLQAGRAPEALALLDGVSVPEDHSIWPTNRWVYLSAAETVGDVARFRAARDQLLDANDRALVGRQGLKKVERFETPVAIVDAYVGELGQSPFIRHMIFIAAPKNGGMFATLSLGSDPATDLLVGKKGLTTDFYDLYPCDGHVTAATESRKQKAPLPVYEKVKRKAVAILSDEKLFPPIARRDEPRFCAFETYMLPGFTEGEG